MEAKDRVLELSDIRVYMEEAGFVRASHGNNWHCGVHDDHSASVSVRDNKCHCWACDRIWDAIEMAMQATGENFVSAVKRMAKEHGIKIDRYIPESVVDRDAARRDRINSYYWKIGMLSELRQQLESAKVSLFRLDGIDVNSAAAIREITPKIEAIDSHSAHRATEVYREHLSSNKKQAERIVKIGMYDDENSRLITNEVVKILEKSIG